MIIMKKLILIQWTLVKNWKMLIVKKNILFFTIGIEKNFQFKKLIFSQKSYYFKAILTSHLHKKIKLHIARRTRHWNTGLVSGGASLPSWGEGASLAFVGHPSSGGVTIKMPYGIDVLHWPALHFIFSYWVG